MNARIVVLLVLAAAVSLLPGLLADVIILDGGARVEGDIVEESEETLAIVLPDGSKLIVQKEDLEKIEREGDEESPFIIDDLLVTPPPDVTGAPVVSPEADVTPPATDSPETTAGPARQPGGKEPEPSGVGWSLESLLPKSLRESGSASAVIFGGFFVATPFLALAIWGMAYVVKIEEPTLLKSLASVLAAMGIFIAGYLALQGLYPQAQLDSYLVFFIVNFVLAVVVAQAVYRANFLQAFLLWALPLAIVVAISVLIRRL